MSYEDKTLADLVREIKQASANIADGDSRVNKRLDELARSINELYLKAAPAAVGTPERLYQIGRELARVTMPPPCMGPLGSGRAA